MSFYSRLILAFSPTDLVRAVLVPAVLTSAILTFAPAAFAERTTADDESHIDDTRVQHRSYVFEPTGETLPYAIFVPSSYDPNGSESLPLLVSLHGVGRSYDWLMGYHGLLDQAEESGYAVVTPLGYIREGWYGSRPAEDPQDGIYSEQDVMNVLDLVRDELRIDNDRIFLWGHSMGGGGTYHLAAKHPEVFAALGVAAPAPAISAPMDEILDKIAHLPIFILQGDQDELVPVFATRTWVAGMAARGMQHLYVEIEGGDHSLLISQDANNMQKFIDFFNIVGHK
ncbi:MAG: prolyl oligopeptidase family serine peptidase [Pseudomonadales bacterium]|nr:prolyl oligopeptidase family serine peptidase [Pseudomonadales bacterium]